MSDLIDRDAAIDALNDEFTITGKTNVIVVQDYIRRVNNRLHDLPSAPPQKVCVAEIQVKIDDLKDYIDKAINAERWIPLSERPPEETGSYLVSGIWASGKTDVGDCIYSAVDGYFETAWNFDVIAWMHLPEAYKGE